MKKINIITQTFLLVAITLSVFADERPIAFKQQDMADCVLQFYTWREYQIIRPKPKSETNAFSGQNTLDKAIAELDKKDLVEIILDKRATFNTVPISEQIYKLITYFTHKGFKRIIIQQAFSDICPEGIPILRDVRNDKSS